jgi:hypothetical protein
MALIPDDDNAGFESQTDNSGLDDSENLEDSGVVDSPVDDDGQASPDGGEGGQAPVSPGGGREASRRQRFEEHKAIVGLKTQLAESNRRAEENQRRLNDALERIGGSMTDATRSLADTARGMREPPKKSIEERMADEMAQAAARVLPADQDNGASSRAYFSEMAKINAKYAREVGMAEAHTIVAAELKKIPRPPSGPNVVYLGIAPWLTDPFHNDGVEREIIRLRRDGRDMSDQRVRDRTIREAIVKYANAEKLDYSMPAPPKGSRSSPAVGGGGARSSFAASPGEGQQRMPAATPAIERMASEHPMTKHIKDPRKRVSTFMEKILAPELQEDA